MSDAQRWASARAAARAATYSTFGVAALHFADGVGVGVACRVMRRMPDETTQFGGGQFVAGTMVLDVLAAEVATVARDDVFRIGSEFLRVTGEPRRDVDRLIWTAEVRAE